MASPGEKTVLSKILDTVRSHGLIQAGARVLVGLSGGADSLALLLGLQRLAPRLHTELLAAYVDHGVRPEAAAEGARVKAASEGRGVPCHVVRVDVGAWRGPHVSLQDAARRARLDALAAHAASEGCHVVALGHNADDQAETVLFRILRGTGVRGLAGIPYRRGVFVRPLLDVRRAEIERFIARQGVEPVRDPSNEDRRFSRVRLRLDWLPALAKENPRIVEALLALADDARFRATGRNAVATNEALPALPPRVSARLARLAAQGGSASLDVPGGRVEVRYGQLAFEAAGSAAPQPLPGKASLARPTSEGHVEVAWPGSPFTLVARLVPLDFGSRPAARSERGLHAGDAVLFDADCLVWPLTVRSWRTGDRLRPRGGRGSRKLQDLFVDAKVPRDERPRVPVLVDAAGQVLWVAGLRASERGAPTEATRTCVQIVLENRHDLA